MRHGDHSGGSSRRRRPMCTSAKFRRSRQKTIPNVFRPNGLADCDKGLFAPLRRNCRAGERRLIPYGTAEGYLTVQGMQEMPPPPVPAGILHIHATVDISHVDGTQGTAAVCPLRLSAFIQVRFRVFLSRLHPQKAFLSKRHLTRCPGSVSFLP